MSRYWPSSQTGRQLGAPRRAGTRRGPPERRGGRVPPCLPAPDRAPSRPRSPSPPTSAMWDRRSQLRDLPVEGVGLDFCRGPENLALLSDAGGLGAKVLFAGVVDGRNVWADDLDASLGLLNQLTSICEEVVVSTSCSFLHVPLGLARGASTRRRGPPVARFRRGETGRAGCADPRPSKGGPVAEAIETNQAALEARRHSPGSRNPDDPSGDGIGPRRSPTVAHVRGTGVEPQHDVWACRGYRPRPSGRSPRPPSCAPQGGVASRHRGGRIRELPAIGN